MRIRFREVEKNIDKEILSKANKEKEEAYRQIKPETNMTIEEATSFLDSLFAAGGES